MKPSSDGQVAKSAASIYEQFFVPALFDQWPERLLERTQIQSGNSFLDVACGTGILARKAEAIIGEAGQVIGIDPNEGMLAIAASANDRVDWLSGVAETLPFDDNTFDSVASQFGLMFFADRIGALAEMARVAKPGGSVVIAVWDDVENSPGYSAMIQLLQHMFGKEIADELRAPYELGDVSALGGLFEKAGVNEVNIERVAGTANFASIDAWVTTDIKGWTLADKLDDAQFAELQHEAQTALRDLAAADGAVEFKHDAIIASASI